jgi:hypothetical protein
VMPSLYLRFAPRKLPERVAVEVPSAGTKTTPASV